MILAAFVISAIALVSTLIILAACKASALADLADQPGREREERAGGVHGSEVVDAAA